MIFSNRNSGPRLTQGGASLVQATEFKCEGYGKDTSIQIEKYVRSNDLMGGKIQEVEVTLKNKGLKEVGEWLKAAIANLKGEDRVSTPIIID